MKNYNDTIGNGTRNLPARSAVPQPTAPPRGPHIVQKRRFYWIPRAFISSLYNYYQLLNVLSVLSCAEIL